LRGGKMNKLNLEVKRYAKVEKIPGGTLEDSCVLDGVMFNKDLTHP
jgi:T-complex protein 1 subunit gamma